MGDVEVDEDDVEREPVKPITSPYDSVLVLVNATLAMGDQADPTHC
jgi:hypothetical protein